MWVEKNGPTWRIRDEVNGKKVTLKGGFPTKSSANAAMTGLKADRFRGDFIDPRGGRVSLNDWLDMWWPTYEINLKPTARLSEGSRVRIHIRPGLGQLPLDDIDGLTIQRWMAQMLTGRPGRRKLAPKTARNVHGLLHRILQAAVTQRLIRANPCTDTNLPKVPHKEMRFLTEPEIGRLIAAVPRHWRPLVLLLVSTGLRWGEATGLAVKHVDVLDGKLTVLRAMHELATTGEIVFTEPKTERGRRTVPFPKRVGMALAGQVAGKSRDELVFTAPQGGPVRTRNFRRGWVVWCRQAGLEGLRIHDLRHTHVGTLLSAKKPPSLTAIQRRLGHSSIMVTSDLYGHLTPAVDAGILAAVEAALEGIDPALLDAELADELADELAEA